MKNRHKRLPRLLAILLVVCTTTTAFPPITAQAYSPSTSYYRASVNIDWTKAVPLKINNNWNGTLFEYMKVNKASMNYFSYYPISRKLLENESFKIKVNYDLNNLTVISSAQGVGMWVPTNGDVYYKYPKFSSHIWTNNYMSLGYNNSTFFDSAIIYGGSVANVKSFQDLINNTANYITITLSVELNNGTVLFSSKGNIPVSILYNYSSDLNYGNLKEIYDMTIPKNLNDKITMPLFSMPEDTMIDVANLHIFDKLTLTDINTRGSGDSSTAFPISETFYYVKPIYIDQTNYASITSFNGEEICNDTIVKKYTPKIETTLYIPLSNTTARQAIPTQAGLPTTITTAGLYTNANGTTYQVFTYSTPTTTGALTLIKEV